MPLLTFLERNPLVFFFGLLLGLILFFGVGLKIGRDRRRMIGEGADEGATLVVGSVLGLLAFVLALNLSNASSRQEMRVRAGLDEVNAIGTALMQAQSVAGDDAGPIAERLKEYLSLRYRYIRAAPHSEEIQIVTTETDRLQVEIWDLLTRRIQQEQTPAVVSLMNALNNAFDSTTTVRLVMDYRMPMQLVMLLLLMSLLGGGTVGYQFGLTNRKGKMAAIVLSFLWCTVVTAIIDIGSGRIWSFRTDSRVYEWSLTGLGMPLPPTVE